LLEGNQSGLTNRRGYFYTGTIGHGLDKRSRGGGGGAGSRALRAFSVQQLQHVGILLETLHGCVKTGGQQVLVVKLAGFLTPSAAVPPLKRYWEQLRKLTKDNIPRDDDVELARLLEQHPVLWDVLIVAAHNPCHFCRCYNLVLRLLVTAIGT
jgi:hypothetical protein